jgi:hypothetical protein
VDIFYPRLKSLVGRYLDVVLIIAWGRFAALWQAFNLVGDFHQ